MNGSAGYVGDWWVRFVLGEPKNLYGISIGSMNVPARWYCVLFQGDDIGHVVRARSGRPLWHVYRHGKEWPWAEPMEFEARQDAALWLMECWAKEQR